MNSVCVLHASRIDELTAVLRAALSFDTVQREANTSFASGSTTISISGPGKRGGRSRCRRDLADARSRCSSDGWLGAALAEEKIAASSTVVSA
jgi:hypothetical protein